MHLFMCLCTDYQLREPFLTALYKDLLLCWAVVPQVIIVTLTKTFLVGLWWRWTSVLHNLCCYIKLQSRCLTHTAEYCATVRPGTDFTAFALT
jgi:hypothetical protein